MRRARSTVQQLRTAVPKPCAASKLHCSVVHALSHGPSLSRPLRVALLALLCRPTLSAQIQSADKMWSSAAAFVGPWLAAGCSYTVGSYFSEYLVSIFTLISQLILLSIPGASTQHF